MQLGKSNEIIHCFIYNFIPSSISLRLHLIRGGARRGKRERERDLQIRYNLYYNSEVCVCLSVCLCRFYLKTVNGNDLILFAN